ncbi:MAG: hypothetical protein FWG20_03085 [Candidatus Cloacimonetes bacterium]|nr:hypothetical protein [Candidatus Cloacimonadota bacterium]
MKNLIFTIVLVLVILSCSESNKTKNSSPDFGGFKDPLIPSMGAEWPTNPVLSQFALSGFDKPNGIEDIEHRAIATATSTISGTKYVDLLEIYFGVATDNSRYETENYLYSNGYVVSEVYGSSFYGWKIVNNILYSFDCSIRSLGGHFYAQRTTGSVLNIGFPSTFHLSLFNIDDFPNLAGISSMYYTIENEYQPVFTGKFSGGNLDIFMQLQDYFSEKTSDGVSESHNGWYIVRTENFTYYYTIHRRGEIIELDFSRNKVSDDTILPF